MTAGSSTRTPRSTRLDFVGISRSLQTCSYFMDYENFTKVIRQAAQSAHKRLRQVEYRTQAADHPILWAADESYYLKFYIFQVCEEK